MSNSTLIAPSTKNSSAVQKRRRKLYQLRQSSLISPLAFAQMHGGSLRMKYTQGLYFVGFESVDKKTHAWGNSFTRAYRNFLKMFNEKYAA